MDLSISEEDAELAASVREFVRRQAPPEELNRLARSNVAPPSSWTSQMVDAGWLGILVPVDLGGSGGTALQAAVIAEEFGRGPLPGAFLSSSIVCAALLSAADDSPERNDLLRGIATGSVTLVGLLTPAGQSWSGLRAPVEATESPSGTLTGAFSFVMHASSATHLLVPLESTGSVIEFGVVEASAPEVRCRPLHGFLADSSEVVLAGAAVVARVRSTPASVATALSVAYSATSAFTVGGCQRLLERSIEYCGVRRQFGSPIGRFPRVQDHVVELVNAVDAARWSVYDALWRIDSGLPSAAGAHRAKAIASEAYLTSADAAHKVHGGVGMDPDFGITHYTQQSRSLFEFLGSPRWHKRQMADALGWTRAIPDPAD